MVRIRRLSVLLMLVVFVIGVVGSNWSFAQKEEEPKGKFCTVIFFPTGDKTPVVTLEVPHKAGCKLAEIHLAKNNCRCKGKEEPKG